jgi:hypothetical protein
MLIGFEQLQLGTVAAKVTGHELTIAPIPMMTKALPATTDPATTADAPRVTVDCAFNAPTKDELAPNVAAAPTHQFTLAHDAPPIIDTTLLAPVLRAAGVLKVYAPAPDRISVPVMSSAVAAE